jgi:transposase
MKKFNEAIDQERRDEVKRLKAQGEESVLIRSRWILLKRPAKLSDSQIVRLNELVKANLSCVKAYLMREQFQRFWEYQRAAWASKFLDQWITQALQSNIEPMKKVAKSLRKHQPLILNWFKAGGILSPGTVEGFNNKAKLTIKKAYGFRSVL